MNDSRTNAREFLGHEMPRLQLPIGYRCIAKMRSVLGRVKAMDDFDWNLYNLHYRSEIAWNQRYFTEDLRTIDYKVIDGKIYILGDCKPLHPVARCVYEAVYQLPECQSVAEIGVGGGRFTANLQALLAPSVQFAAYDISEQQLRYFREQYPAAYQSATVGVLDLTRNAVPEPNRSDVVLAVTVLMHIQRPDAYKQALWNLLQSSKKYVVLLDNWNSHDYMSDLRSMVAAGDLFAYDSGANIAVIVNRNGALKPLCQPLSDTSVLGKYLPNYKY